MNKYEIVQKIEEFAPLETQESWDASGWIVDLETSEVNKVMYALTITDKVFKEAVDKGCDLIISHHPLFYVPLEYRRINMYSAHTNLDRAKGGTTDVILQKLGFTGVGDDFVRIVTLENPMSVEDLKKKLLKIFPHLRYVNNFGAKTVRTIGFCAGSGSEFINSEPIVDAFVTGDLKFHTALEAKPVVFDIGHFESEIFAPELLEKVTGVRGVIADEKSPFIND